MTEDTLNSESCFCCGKENEKGLKMTFEYENSGIVKSETIIPEYFTGWERITHGGFLSMMLDEIMAHACINAGFQAVTGELKVRFAKPVNVGEKISMSALVVKDGGRLLETKGTILNTDGETVARGEARFFKT